MVGLIACFMPFLYDIEPVEEKQLKNRTIAALRGARFGWFHGWGVQRGGKRRRRISAGRAWIPSVYYKKAYSNWIPPFFLHTHRMNRIEWSICTSAEKIFFGYDRFEV
jgi:hypothetical protein